MDTQFRTAVFEVFFIDNDMLLVIYKGSRQWTIIILYV
jgi:hypothetical protein